jgi:thiamine-monophosphate kinase
VASAGGERFLLLTSGTAVESEFIAWLRQRLPPHPQLRLGIGDDAAILRLANAVDCVVTIDTLMDGVDFRLTECDPRRAGRKALAVNLSDLAAMAARPVAAVVSLVVPRENGKPLAVELYEGLLPLAQQFNVAIAGGDTNSWDGPLVISITAIGEVTQHGPWLRSGARPGDEILVTGSFGGSILGKHFDFQPRVNESLLLSANYRINAAIDVSDGLSLDLSRVAAESDCGAALDLNQIPIAADARRLEETRGDGITALEHALSDGEDFELILAVPPDEAQRLLADQPLDVPLTRIGRFVDQPSLWQQFSDGSRQPLAPRGYEH